MMNDEDAVFDPAKNAQTQNGLAKLETTMVHVLHMLGNINRNLIAIEAAILGTDMSDVDTTVETRASSGLVTITVNEEPLS